MKFFLTKGVILLFFAVTISLFFIWKATWEETMGGEAAGIRREQDLVIEQKTFESNRIGVLKTTENHLQRGELSLPVGVPVGVSEVLERASFSTIPQVSIPQALSGRDAPVSVESPGEGAQAKVLLPEGTRADKVLLGGVGEVKSVVKGVKIATERTPLVKATSPVVVDASLGKPAVFGDPSVLGTLSASQQNQMAAIASDFVQSVQASGALPSSPQYRAVWDTALYRADEAFRGMFGVPAFNAMQMARGYHQ